MSDNDDVNLGKASDNHILSKKLLNDGCGYFGNDFVKLPVEIIPTHQLSKK